ncbi:hypothetical protein Dimus_009218 [Dionaea muscipula]
MYGVYIYLYYKCKYTCGSVHRFLRALGLQTVRNRNHKDSGWMSTAQMPHLGVFVYLTVCLAVFLISGSMLIGRYIYNEISSPNFFLCRHAKQQRSREGE